MFKRQQKLLHDESGGTLAVFAIALPILVGAIAVSVEAGYWMKSKSDVQLTADMAAYAGARELVSSSDRDALIAAKLDALNNGYEFEAGQIEVNSPPSTGDYTGASAIEVIITQSGTKFFSGLVGDSAVTYKVRSVAAIAEGADACMLSLNTSASGALDVWGSSTVALDGCEMVSNSTSSSSIKIGNSASLTADCLSTAGGIVANSTPTLTCSSSNENVSPVADPYASLAPPDITVAPYNTCNSVGKPNKWWRTLTPGRYCGSNLSFKDRTFLSSPGTYVFDGIDVSFKSNYATLEGTGVTIILMNGATLSGINGGATLNLTPPALGQPYAGVTIFSDPNTQPMGTNVKLNGSAWSSIEGLVYFPNENLEFGGNVGTSSKCTLVVADTVKMTGNSDLSMSGCESTYGLDTPGLPGGIFIVE